MVTKKIQQILPLLIGKKIVGDIETEAYIFNKFSAKQCSQWKLTKYFYQAKNFEFERDMRVVILKKVLPLVLFLFSFTTFFENIFGLFCPKMMLKEGKVGGDDGFWSGIKAIE